LHSGYYLLDSGGNDGVGTRRGAALMRAGFESEVKRGPAGAVPGFFDGEDFGVFYAGPSVETAAYDGVITHDHSAYCGIRADPA